MQAPATAVSVGPSGPHWLTCKQSSWSDYGAHPARTTSQGCTSRIGYKRGPHKGQGKTLGRFYATLSGAIFSSLPYYPTVLPLARTPLLLPYSQAMPRLPLAAAVLGLTKPPFDYNIFKAARDEPRPKRGKSDKPQVRGAAEGVIQVSLPMPDSATSWKPWVVHPDTLANDQKHRLCLFLNYHEYLRTFNATKAGSVLPKTGDPTINISVDGVELPPWPVTVEVRSALSVAQTPSLGTTLETCGFGGMFNPKELSLQDLKDGYTLWMAYWEGVKAPFMSAVKTWMEGEGNVAEVSHRPVMREPILTLCVNSKGEALSL